MLNKVSTDSTAGATIKWISFNLSSTSIYKCLQNQSLNKSIFNYLTHAMHCTGIEHVLQLNTFEIDIGTKEALKIRPCNADKEFLTRPTSLKAIL